jgi:hypothetical protein
MAAVLSFSLFLASFTFAQHAYPTNVARQASASALPLTDYHYTYPNLPYQVNPYPSGRGPQSGYNICNSTTEGPNSECQTMFVNSIADFCIWGSPVPDGTIGDVEAAVVAYCTQPGHGTRVMPAGTLKSVQFMRTPAYIQVSGQFNQVGINLAPNDTGGELDPHGADLAGNPLGGLVFSNSLPSTEGVITQGDNWSNFVGSGFFCIKVCDNSITNPDFCENIFDLIGCAYNMPSDSYTTTEFTDCQGDNQLPPGQYVSDGQTITWSQPASLTPGSTLPWQPSVPPSSSCTTYTSSLLYSLESGGSTAITTGTARSSPTGTGTGTGAASTAQATGGAVTAAGARVGTVAAALAAVGVLLA